LFDKPLPNIACASLFGGIEMQWRKRRHAAQAG
jgi:hypothetical protein